MNTIIDLSNYEKVIIFLALVNCSLDEMHSKEFREKCDKLAIKFETILNLEAQSK